VIAIYARENGQGMAFPMPSETASSVTETETPATVTPPRSGPRLTLTDAPGSRGTGSNSAPGGDDVPPTDPPSGGRPSLKRIK
jgi:stringent starvation protein B